MLYRGWPPGQAPSENDVRIHMEEEICLSLQWTPSPGPLLPSGLYWKVQRCDLVGKNSADFCFSLSLRIYKFFTLRRYGLG